MWLVPAVLAPLIIRKPGAALFAEMVAAGVSALLGSQWGPDTLLSGFVQGAAAELVFALDRLPALVARGPRRWRRSPPRRRRGSMTGCIYYAGRRDRRPGRSGWRSWASRRSVFAAFGSLRWSSGRCGGPACWRDSRG